MSGRYTTLEDRFWLKVQKGDGCWEWQGWLSRYGYGMLTSGPRGSRFKHTAHRVSWEIANGPIPDRLMVLHHCDDRRCVRPDHLFLGTNEDNMADMVAKGRARGGRLTDEDVRFIRASRLPQRLLAGLFGFHQSNISRIQTGDTYRRVA